MDLRRALLALVAFLVEAPAFGAGLRVDEATTRIALHEERFELRLALVNSTGLTLAAKATAELLDPSDVVRARADDRVSIGPGLQAVDLVLRPGVAALAERDRSQILLYRVRYRLDVSVPPQGLRSPLEGTLAVSRVSPDVFELRLLAEEAGHAGRPLHVTVFAGHPVTFRPVRGVTVRARFVIDEAQEGSSSATQVTDAGGIATFAFEVPPDLPEDAECRLEVSGRRSGLSAEVSTEIDLYEVAEIFVSTDKPLYQPGQVLHARALARRFEGSVLGDVPVRTIVTDEEGATVHSSVLRTSRFGIAAMDWTIPEHLRLGRYYVRVETEEGEFDGSGGAEVRITRYQLPQFSVQVVPDRSYYLPGDSARISVNAEYVFGKPVSSGQVRVVLEASRRWSHAKSRYEVEERSRREGRLSEGGHYAAQFELDEGDDFPDRDGWQPYADIHGTAYVTDASTGRTEQGRFTLRTSRDAIHPYLAERYAEGCEQGAGACLASFYLTTYYADGTPAASDVEVARGTVGAGPGESRDLVVGAEVLAKVRTNRFGLAKVTDLGVREDGVAPGPDPGPRRLVLVARDAQGRVGRRVVTLGSWGSSRLSLDTARTIHAPGQAVEVRLQSKSVLGPVLVEIRSGRDVLASRLARLRGTAARLTFPYSPRFRGALNVVATPMEEGDDSFNGRSAAARGILYPAEPELAVDVQSDRREYEPGDHAELRLALKQRDGRPTAGALGVVVLDRAIEERAAQERDQWSPAGLLGAFEKEELAGGVSLGELLAFAGGNIVPPDQDLAAEVALWNAAPSVGRLAWSGRFDRDAGTAFAARFQAQLGPVAAALEASFELAGEGPQDAAAVTRALDAAPIPLTSMRDPWARPFRLTVGTSGHQRTVAVVSAGPDGVPASADDVVALTRSWSYFAPRGRLIARAAERHYERTGLPIRDWPGLRAELQAEAGEDVDAWRDPWGQPLLFAFTNAGRLAVITTTSAGPPSSSGSAFSPAITLSVVRTDAFARTEAVVQEALRAWFADTERLPETAAEWVEALDRAGLQAESLLDLWGRPATASFRREHPDALETAVRTYADLLSRRGDGPRDSPLPRVTDLIALRSGGPDGGASHADDFDIARFRRPFPVPAPRRPSAPGGEAAAPRAGTGAIAGTLTDATGGAIPGVQVEVWDEGTGQAWTATTGSQGRYEVDGLPRGVYCVRFTLIGFQAAIVTQIPVEAGWTTPLDVDLRVGTMAEEISVAAESPVLETTQASMSVVTHEAAPEGTRKPMATPRVRREFPETLYWNPALETDDEGHARIRLELADTLTTWKIGVVGSTLGGQFATATRELLAFRSFFVENDPPPVLTSGDAIKLPALVRSYAGEALEAKVTLRAEGGLRIEGPDRRDVNLPAGEAGAATFDVVAQGPATRAKLVLSATSHGSSDAVEKGVIVVPDGAEGEVAVGQLIEDGARLDFAIPPEAITGTLRAELVIQPNLATHVLESVEGVLRRPYGCAEQTISSAYPSLFALRLLSDGWGEGDVEGRAQRYLGVGHQRLRAYQSADGGFEYFGGSDGDVALTAYALRFLTDAEAFLAVDRDMVSRAISFLLSKQQPDGGWRAPDWRRDEPSRGSSFDLTAVVARALAVRLTGPTAVGGAGDVGSRIRAALDRSISFLGSARAGRDDAYGLSSFVLVARAAQRAAEERSTLAALRSRVRRERTGVSWEPGARTPFFGWGRAGRIETTALAVKALAGAEDASDRTLARQGLLYLLANRDRFGVWWSGQATVNVLDALVSALGTRPTATDGDVLTVEVNGEDSREVALPGDSRDAAPRHVDVTPLLVPGPNRITLRRRSGGGKLSAQLIATYFTPWPQHRTPRPGPLRLDIHYDRAEVRRGEEMRVRVRAERTDGGYGMLLAEIGLPPGVDVDRESLERAVNRSGHTFSRYEVRPDRVVAYLWARAGGTSFDFVVRPRLAMRAQSAASLLYDLYNPESAVVVPPRRFDVRE
jgi:hypothetical protein